METQLSLVSRILDHSEDGEKCHLGIPIWTSYFDILQIIQLDHVIITKVNNHWKSF